MNASTPTPFDLSTLADTVAEASLRAAIENEDLILHYQPQIDMAGGWPRITGYEALVRWCKDSGQILYPDAFIPLAERSGLIFPLDLWVIETACRTAAEGFLHIGTERRISVNVSSRSLVQPDFCVKVSDILQHTGLAPDRLTLEITETALIENPSAAIETVTCLRRLGVALSLDDFGTGFSSLSYLQNFPVCEIKLDRSFISRLPGEKETLIVGSTIDLALSLGLSVVAEGVETACNAKWLTGRGCTRMQGYLFGHPAALRSSKPGRRSIMLLPN